MIKDAAYWITLAHIPGWGYAKINSLVVKFHHEMSLSITEFFAMDESQLTGVINLSGEEATALNEARKEVPGNAFLAESMENQGYELIPIVSELYPKTLKENLKSSHSPPLLYIKGEQSILTEKSLAIVGSRTAGEVSLRFTDNIAKLASKEFKVIVSGFAKGVDKQALDSAVKHLGKSIIVLPQGIMTFASGFKTYYKEIQEGNVLVLSTFFPKAPWKVELAMARNSIIYGLANEIFVAESGETGGTWQGVMAGIKRGRKIFIRMPEAGEKNANLLLIQKGAIAVDDDGNVIDTKQNPVLNTLPLETGSEEFDKKILSVFNGGSLSAKEISDKLGLDWSAQKLSKHLKSNPAIKTMKDKKSGTNHYALKEQLPDPQTELFGSPDS